MVASLTAEEALSRLTSEDRRSVEEFRERVSAELGVRLRDLRIFGSKVRGDDHPESDIDLLVLVDDLDPTTYDRILQIAQSISVWIHPIVSDFDSYHLPINRASGLYKELRKESVRL